MIRGLFASEKWQLYLYFGLILIDSNLETSQIKFMSYCLGFIIICIFWNTDALYGIIKEFAYLPLEFPFSPCVVSYNNNSQRTDVIYVKFQNNFYRSSISIQLLSKPFELRENRHKIRFQELVRGIIKSSSSKINSFNILFLLAY